MLPLPGVKRGEGSLGYSSVLLGDVFAIMAALKVDLRNVVINLFSGFAGSLTGSDYSKHSPSAGQYLSSL